MEFWGGGSLNTPKPPPPLGTPLGSVLTGGVVKKFHFTSVTIYVLTFISFRSSCLLKKVQFITSLSLLYIFAVDANHNNGGKVMCFKYFEVLGADTVWDVTPHNFGGICLLFLLHSRESPSLPPSRCHDIALIHNPLTWKMW